MIYLSTGNETFSTVMCSLSFSPNTASRFFFQKFVNYFFDIGVASLFEIRFLTPTPITSHYVIADSIIDAGCLASTATAGPIERVFGFFLN